MYSAGDVASLKVFCLFFAVIHSSQGPQKAIIFLCVEIPGSQEKLFQEQLLTPLVLEEDSSQILVCFLKLSWESLQAPLWKWGEL